MSVKEYVLVPRVKYDMLLTYEANNNMKGEYDRNLEVESADPPELESDDKSPPPDTIRAEVPTGQTSLDTVVIESGSPMLVKKQQQKTKEKKVKRLGGSTPVEWIKFK